MLVNAYFVIRKTGTGDAIEAGGKAADLLFSHAWISPVDHDDLFSPLPYHNLDL
ncbi:MAG: hypothetical protein WCJ37_16410 [Syntrophus sp. (in: bacteria)]